MRSITERRALALLASINWSFDTPLYSRARNDFLFDCRKHHWYPATFIPEIPYSLIEVLSTPGQVVFDPFSGIGTTVLQGLVLGRIPYAIERCRVAVEFLRSIWTLLDPRTDVRQVQDTLATRLKRYAKMQQYIHELPRDGFEYAELLRPWFNEDTFNEIAFLMVQDRRRCTPAVRAASQIALSATLKAVSAQDKGWGCIADNVLPKHEQLVRYRPALMRFNRNYTLLLRSIDATRARLPSGTLEFLSRANVADHIRHGDSRIDKTFDRPSVDLVVSSPPYPSMTDYATSQRLSYYLHRSRPEEDFHTEIGARRRRTRSDALVKYKGDMRSAFSLVTDQMRTGAYACFVMPTFSVDMTNNRRRRQIVDECMTVLVERGLTKVHQLERVLPTRRRHHNQRWTSLERETIHVYRRM